ncbi:MULTISPECIES: DeoR/GlpR family DNA-binding transcription regulator [unclassified Breznakia]|uniref:DeoR/GlpR family DNA-binding transcription regulator n=1 Tax=unclassified Breznakia TaxID=2623764 RepID=UPI00240757D4|nr:MULTISPECIES: DeoR/GlpR family DNA-binding transcription regulator [unclassified Breznakia]MDF9837063.1 DeoR family myo-inositol catabolism operon transcriptional repressor [Breznakia sp. PFB2-8]MDF9858988.1 DeoR family myo-inositol catabolism operon transcriptional repressor [Breznakia sp. PH5-24]
MQNSNKVNKRHEEIRNLLLSNGTVTLQELCSKLNCSQATIRNDLAALEKQGVLKRMYGGAVANENTVRNSRINKRLNENIEEKEQIADYVAKNLIQPNMIITLDSGTTTMALAQKILDYKIPCTVVTNSFNVATIVSKSEVVKLYLAGGFYDSDHGSFHDETSDYILKKYQSELCFISPNGINCNGLITNSGSSENPIKKRMMEHANKTILLADHTKIGISELNILGDSRNVDCLITDNKIKKEQATQLKKAGLKVILAS